MQTVLRQTNKKQINHFSPEQIQAINNELIYRFDELQNELNLNLRKGTRIYQGACPIHCGDNPTALAVYNNSGKWFCFTRHCEQSFQCNIIGLIQAVLSRRLYEWKKEGDRIVSWNDALEFAIKFLGGDIKDLQNRPQIDAFIQDVLRIYKEKKQINGISRDLVRQNLNIPAQYYIDRGYCKDILNKYDIGLCINDKKYMYNRIVVPIYDDKYEKMIGCTARSIYNECTICHLYHDGDCPDMPRPIHRKWLHSKGLIKSEILYNYWLAKTFIKQTRVAVIVESPGNVWRLEESGINNSVAILGCDLSSTQRFILDGSGALALILLLDNDESGRHGTELIKHKCSRLYHIYTPSINKNDIGDMTTEEVKQILLPTISSICEEYSKI